VRRLVGKGRYETAADGVDRLFLRDLFGVSQTLCKRGQVQVEQLMDNREVVVELFTVLESLRMERGINRSQQHHEGIFPFDDGINNPNRFLWHLIDTNEAYLNVPVLKAKLPLSEATFALEHRLELLKVARLTFRNRSFCEPWLLAFLF